MSEPTYVWIRDLKRRVYAPGTTGFPLEEGYWRKEEVVVVVKARTKLVTTVYGLQFTADGLPTTKTLNVSRGLDHCVFSEKEKDDYVFILKHKHALAQRVGQILQRDGSIADAADALRRIEKVLKDLEDG